MQSDKLILAKGFLGPHPLIVFFLSQTKLYLAIKKDVWNIFLIKTPPLKEMCPRDKENIQLNIIWNDGSNNLINIKDGLNVDLLSRRAQYFVPHFGLTINDEVYMMWPDGKIKVGPRKYLHLFSNAVTIDKQRIISNSGIKLPPGRIIEIENGCIINAAKRMKYYRDSSLPLLNIKEVPFIMFQ